MVDNSKICSLCMHHRREHEEVTNRFTGDKSFRCNYDGCICNSKTFEPVRRVLFTVKPPPDEKAKAE